MKFAANAEDIRTKGHKNRRTEEFQDIRAWSCVLMFPALAARYGVSPYVSLATRTLVRGQPRSGLLCILCKLMLLMFSALSG